MRSGTNWLIRSALIAAALTCTFAVGANAQVQTTTTTSPNGKPTKQVTVEHGTVVLVQGNDLIVKADDGTIRHFPNIPDSARIMVDGKSLGIHDLKPGMRLQRTITTTSTPKTVQTVQTVTGTVWNVMPPLNVTLTLEDGRNQTFKIPKGQKFDVNGQMTDAFGLKKGMVVKATKIVETPEVVVTQNKTVTGTMPPAPPQQQAQKQPAAAPPAAPPADVPILVAVVEEETVATTALPKTASELPLVGLLGLLCVGASFAMKIIRTSVGA